MRIHRTLVRVLPLLALMLAAPSPMMAATEAMEQRILLRYAAYWGGFHAADAVLALRQEDGRYEVAMEIAARGLLAWLLDPAGAGRSRGVLDGGEIRPRLFRYYEREGGEESVREVTFDPATGVSRGRERARDMEWSGRAGGWQEKALEDVPLALRVGVFDPLSLIPVLRREIPRVVREGRQGLELPVYDGKKRFDVVLRINGLGSEELAGRRVSTVDVTVRARPLAGFSRSKAETWRDATVEMQLDRRSLLPVRILARKGAIATVIRAVDACAAQAGCDFTLTPEARTALGR